VWRDAIHVEHHMRHRIAIAALAAAALIAVACEDQGAGSRRLATEPGDGATSSGEVHYRTTGSAAVVSKHRLQPVAPARPAPGVSASIVAGSGVVSAMTVYASEPGIATTSGQRTSTFTDASNHHHTIALMYGSTGGPPLAMLHYVDGSLVSTTAYSWLRTSTGWVRTRSYLQVGLNGKLYGTYTTTTVATTSTPISGGSGTTGTQSTVMAKPAGGASTLQRMAGGAAYGLAYIFAPQDATAQSYALSLCSQQWLRYAAAAAVVVGIEILIADAPYLTPALITQLGSALALLAAAEDALLDCVLSHQPIPLIDNWSGTGSSGGSGGGSNGGCVYGFDCITPAYTL
jgi:hypothetical protein